MKFKFSAGDTGSKLRATCKNDSDGIAIDLTGASVHLLWRDAASALQTRAMTIVSATGGIVEYQFLANELFAPRMLFRVRITDAGGKILHNVNVLTESVAGAP